MLNYFSNGPLEPYSFYYAANNPLFYFDPLGLVETPSYSGFVQSSVQILRTFAQKASIQKDPLIFYRELSAIAETILDPATNPALRQAAINAIRQFFAEAPALQQVWVKIALSSSGLVEILKGLGGIR